MHSFDNLLMWGYGPFYKNWPTLRKSTIPFLLKPQRNGQTHLASVPLKCSENLKDICEVIRIQNSFHTCIFPPIILVVLLPLNLTTAFNDNLTLVHFSSNVYNLDIYRTASSCTHILLFYVMNLLLIVWWRYTITGLVIYWRGFC